MLSDTMSGVPLDRNLALLLMAVAALILATGPLIVPGSGIACAVALGIAIIAIQIVRMVTGVVDFRSLEEWAIWSFVVWMPVGFLKYWLGVDVVRTIEPSVVDRCAILTCLGFGAYTVGALAAGNSAPRPSLLATAPVGWGQRLVAPLAVGAALAMRASRNIFGGGIEAVPGLGYGLLLASVPVATGLSVSTFLARRRVAAAVVTALAALAVGVGDTSRRVFGSILFAVGFAVIPRRGFRIGLTSIRGVVTLGFLLAVFYGTATLMRAVTFGSGDPEAVKEDFVAAGRTARNLSTLEDFALCVELYPQRVPFLYGRSYVAMLLTFVPRQWWPDKPVAFAKELAVRKLYTLGPYQYDRDLDAAIGYQSFSGTMIGEAWANFGWLGVIVVLALYGVVVEKVSAYLCACPPGSWGEALLGPVAFAVLVQHRGCSTAANGFVLTVLPIVLAAALVSGRIAAPGWRSP